MDLKDAIDAIRTRPTVPVWPHVGVLLGVSRNSAYEGAKRGDFEVMTVGKRKLAISASLRRKLGIEAA